MVGTPQPQAGRDARRPPEALERRWLWLVALGVLMVVLGLLALSSAVVTTLASVVAFGLLALIAGIAQIVAAFSARRWAGFSLHLIVGILAGVVGVMLIRAPTVGAETLTLLLAAWLLVSGLSQVVYAAFARFHQWAWSAATGVITALLGLTVLAQWPISSLWFIGLYIGLYLIIQGLSWIAASVVAHNMVERFRRRPPAEQPAA